jgi:hypothetical protein
MRQQMRLQADEADSCGEKKKADAAENNER